MCLLVESIKIQNRIPQNIEGHNARLNKSRIELFGLSDVLDLRDFLKLPDDLNAGTYKCRVVYAEAVKKIEFIPYVPRVVRTLDLVDGGNIEYEHKYLDRTHIDRLKDASKADDILIVKEGRITDASSANVVFFDGVSWITPDAPLLRGTKRQLLLDAGRIFEKGLKEKDLQYFQKAVLINAMLDFDINNFIPIENIYLR
jgi:4-amino-4-deoxychorismate lyase